MSRASILTALTGLASAHETVLGNVRSHVLSGQASTPYDPARPLFLAVTLSPSEWETVGRIERRGAEVDDLFASARRELGNSGDTLASAVQRHEATPQRITEEMSSLNADISSLTAALAAKSVVFSWGSLPSK